MRLWEQGLSGRCGLYAGPSAVKQSGFEVLFESPNRGREGRLADAGPARGLGEGTGLIGEDKVAELVEHSITSTYGYPVNNRLEIMESPDHTAGGRP
jgi:hypothetical protein